MSTFSRQTLVIVEPGIKLWGSERALAATLKSLIETWHRVVLIMPSGAELADELRANPDHYGRVEIREAPIGTLHKRGRLARLLALLALAGLMIRLRPDRVYLNQAGLIRMLAPLARCLQASLVVHVRLLEDVARVTPFRGTPRAPLHAIFISDAMLSAAGNSVLPTGTHWHMAYDPYPKPAILQPQVQKAEFVCVGRLSHGKGMHLLVDALALPGLTDVRAEIFGTGVEGDDYSANLAILTRPLRDRIKLMGFHRDVLTRLPAYRFLVSTSRFEPLGRVVMEAWDAGLVPIVYAGSGGAAEMVRKSGAGLLFEHWDAKSLSLALRTALEMPEEDRRLYIDAGRSWMAQTLDMGSYQTTLRGVIF